MFSLSRLHEITIATAPAARYGPHHCTFVFNKSKLLAIGVNKFRTSPQNLKYDYIGRNGEDSRHLVGVHSELDAVLKLGSIDCARLTFVNTRLDARNNLNMARPCRGCQHLLSQIGYKNFYFTNTNGKLEKYS